MRKMVLPRIKPIRGRRYINRPGFVEDAATLPPSELSDTELEQYSRNINYFSRVDTQPKPSPYEHQLRLKNARVTVQGTGLPDPLRSFYSSYYEGCSD
jgi:hypothetical protein